MHPADENFAVFDVAPAVFEVYLPGADTFDLRAEKLDAGLIGFVDEIIVPRLFVFGDGFDAFLFQNCRLLSFGIRCFYIMLLPSMAR